ncbi:patched family protein, partial [Trichuris suis]
LQRKVRTFYYLSNNNCLADEKQCKCKVRLRSNCSMLFSKQRRRKIVHDGEEYSYSSLCMSSYGTCLTNDHIAVIQGMYDEPEIFGRLTFPKVKVAHHELYLGQALGGVTVNSSGARDVSRSGTVVEAKAWMLVYQLRFDDHRYDLLSGLWEHAFERSLLSYNNSLVEVSPFHSQTLDTELSKNAQNLGPRVTVCFVVLICFAMACTLSVVKKDGRWWAVDWNRSAPWLAVAGVFSAGMGVSTAVGLLSLLGVHFCEVVAVMPFLVISVRLDNTFLMLSALSHTKESLPVEERIPEAMAEAAVSITITVLTDVISFAVGYLTDFLAVQLFCLYTCVAMMTSFMFQLTLLLGFIVLHARNERCGKHAIFPCFLTIPADEISK